MKIWSFFQPFVYVKKQRLKSEEVDFFSRSKIVFQLKILITILALAMHASNHQIITAPILYVVYDKGYYVNHLLSKRWQANNQVKVANKQKMPYWLPWKWATKIR
jgi:hypothetical protein